jgi:predicted nucleic acid-binding protein
MPQNLFDNIIISDASCLIALTNINQLDLLKKLYKNINITPEVAKEYTEKYKLELPDWVRIKEAKNKNKVKEMNKILDLGESSSIVLASEIKNSLLIINEKKGRNCAVDIGLLVTGTFGILRQAYERGFIESREKALELMSALKNEKHFRISEKIIENVKSQMKPRASNNRHDPGHGR